MSKDEKTRAKLGTGEVEGEKIVIREKADGVPFTEYAFMSKNISLLTNRVKRERHPSDAYIFTVMCSMLDIRTGICHAKQKDIVTATGLSKSEVSKAVKRLSTPLPPDVSTSSTRPAGFIPAGLPELIRQWKDGGLAGYALHPDIVSIGNNKQRAKILWKQAKQQAEEKAEKAAQAAIQNAAESSLAEELDNIIAEQDIDFL